MRLVSFHPKAEAELDEAAAWYQSKRSGLGKEFRLAVERAVDRISENPQVGSFYGASGFRYVLTRRFPYLVVYAESGQTIWIMAVAHGSRKPGYWKDRTIA
jgi:toxin ParE1/3/4